jgi:HTH-type transcriptional regulator / antitoxin HigA
MIEAFQPDWLSPPGDTIKEVLAERRISLSEFASRLGATIQEATELTQGSAHIDRALAERLEHVLGSSAAFWLNRETQYRLDAARLGRSSQRTDREWLRQLPVSDMIRFGWIECPNNFADRFTACLRFFAVPDVASWYKKYLGELSVAAFRTSPTFESKPGSVLAWLRCAELISDKISCAAWDAGKFRSVLKEIRALTRRKEPSRFLPELRRMCAACGVALVVARAPKGCRASGATRFLTTEKAMIVLSFRHRSDDQFWFTFFHEAGHLLLHGKNALFLEDDSEVSATEEAAANDFAGMILIPPQFRPQLMKLRAEVREIIRFAKTVGVSPGIVVGQLQHLKRVRADRLNGMKRRFGWQAIAGDGFTL